MIFDNWKVIGDPGESRVVVGKNPVCFKVTSGWDMNKWS